MKTASASASAMRAHGRAIFRTHSGLPSYIQEQQRRLEAAITRAGLEDKVPHLLGSISDDRGRVDDPFELFVLGEGKFGKSTLVNALLGYRIAPTDLTPKTWCFNRYVATSSPLSSVRIFVSEELRQRQDCSHLHRWLGKPVGSFRSLDEYHVSTDDALHLAEEEEQRVRATLNRPDAYWSPIMEMEWTVPADRAIVPGIRLVDTMGINQDVATPKSHRHYLRWQYERADAVLWLVSYDRLNAEATRQQLLEARRYSKVVYLLLTRWDKAVNRDDLLARAEELYGNLCTAILPISALAALAAQGLLTEPSSRDEREFAARCRRMAPEDIRKLSGFEALSEALQRFLDGRQRIVRNVQMYSALRQKDREFRRVAIQAREDARENMALYAELQTRLGQAHQCCIELVGSRIQEASDRFTRQIEKGLALIHYDNRHEARSLLGADKIIGDFRALSHGTAEDIDRLFGEVVQWASEPTRCYRSSEFGPTGSVADVALTSSSTIPNVSVPRATVDLEIYDPTGFWAQVKIMALEIAAKTPIIGPMFEQALIEAKTNARARFVDEVRRAWLPKISGKTDEVRNHMLAQVELVNNQLMSDFAEQYERSGGDSAHQACIDRVSSVLDHPIVAPVLISVPLRLMRHYRWRN